jgi:hypothetical protein
MDFTEVSKRVAALKKKYENFHRARGQKAWLTSDYAQGLTGDVGDLTKLLVRRKRLGPAKSLDRDIAKELCDVLYMTISLADELGIRIDKEFRIHLEFLEQRLKEEEAS